MNESKRNKNGNGQVRKHGASRNQDQLKKKLLMIIPVNLFAKEEEKARATKRRDFNQFVQQYVAAVVAPDFEVDVEVIADGEERIESRYGMSQNQPAIIDLVVKARESGEYSGIYIADFDRTGVEVARELVRIPVVGGSDPQIFTALSLAQTFAIITVDERLDPLDTALVRFFGVSSNLTGIYDIDWRVADLNDPTKQGALVGRLIECAAQAVEDGAQAIVLGCTGFLGVAGQVADGLRLRRFDDGRFIDVPVLDPNLVSLAFLQMLVRCGLAQSQEAYRFPPELEGEQFGGKV